MIFTEGLIRLKTQRVTLVGRGGVARSGRVAGSGMMLVFGHRPLLMCCRVVFDALLRGFFGQSNLAYHFFRVLVSAQNQKSCLTHLLIVGPFGERYFANQSWLNPL